MKTTTQILNGIRPEVDYTASSNFIEDGLLDSLDIVKLVAELDANYGISIDGSDIVSRNFIDLASIEKLVQKSKAGN